MHNTPVSTHARRALLRCAVLLCAGALAACGHHAARQTRPARVAVRDWPQVVPANPDAANAVLIRALGLVGTPYSYGGNTPESGFDCSGLVAYVYRDMLDLRLPRTSRELAAVQGPKIDPQRLSTGDLVFFGSAGSVSHVGIYVGEGRFVHAPNTGGTVRLDSLDGPYWRDHYTGAKRVLH
ncbi:C40 family peptidase [Xanthomonas sp. GPE 39]|uniref:C40 family peptidase n=1 Tax=Xanthomonas sp. GPE 39 TaxID=1583099 RepID=UPI0005F2FCCB|nr:C40 family peptidase [Xanthomonas sp. GPE 39]